MQMLTINHYICIKIYTKKTNDKYKTFISTS